MSPRGACLSASIGGPTSHDVPSAKVSSYRMRPLGSLSGLCTDRYRALPSQGIGIVNAIVVMWVLDQEDVSRVANRRLRHDQQLDSMVPFDQEDSPRWIGDHSGSVSKSLWC